MVGDDGPPLAHVREVERPSVIEEARGGIEKEAFGEEECEGGRDGALEGAREGSREGGSCRIRRKPEATSCSAAIEDMDEGSFSFFVDPASKEKRIRAFSELFPACGSRLPVLRFLGMLRVSDAASVFWGGCSSSARQVSCKLIRLHLGNAGFHHFTSDDSPWICDSGAGMLQLRWRINGPSSTNSDRYEQRSCRDWSSMDLSGVHGCFWHMHVQAQGR